MTKPLPTWTKDLSVGESCLDEDHQAFFRLSALLEDLRRLPGEEHESLIETALNILEEYIDGHFLREQTAMIKSEYPLLAEHIYAHDKFEKRVKRAIANYKASHKRAELTSLSRLVTRWLANHIQTMDSQYRGLLTSQNVDDRAFPLLDADM